MRSILLSSLILAGACTGEDPPPPEFDGDIEIGSAALAGTGFIAIEDGADVELVPGAQGGFHVWTGIRVTGAMGELYLNRDARRVSDGTLVMRQDDMFLDVPEAAMTGWWERSEAAASFMCPAPIGVTMFDTEFAFTATLLTEDGEILAEDTMIVTPRCPTGSQLAVCQSICDG